MPKELTSQHLREMGFHELALFHEHGARAEAEARDPPTPDILRPMETSPFGSANESPQASVSDPNAELRRLLGPLVSPLLRDARGSFDPGKVHANNFEEFRDWLLDQVSVDGIAFNQSLLASYHQVLGKAEHEPLLRRLWAEGRGEKTEDPPPAALRRLTADLIAVSAERFVSSHLNDREGRRRLRGILGDPAQYSREIRADLSKAIAAVGERQGIGGLYAHQSEKQISSWNYFNWGVSDAELREAGRLAEEILTVADEQEARIQGAGTQYHDHPERVRALVSKERTIKPEEIRGIARIEAAHREKADPLSQLRTRLARFWLLAADSDNWRVDNAYSGPTHRLYLMAETERLLSLTENVRDEAGLRWLNGRVQEFLAAPLPAKPGSDFGPLAEAWRWLEHKTVGRGLEELFEAVPEGHKSPYLQLKELSHTWKHSVAMGETLLPEVKIPPPLEGEEVQGDSAELRRAVSHLSSELHKTKHQFWYQYKQHKALSRGASNVASWFGAGDIEDIREANRWIDDCLRRLAGVRAKEDLEEELKGLYRELKKDGRLFAAMEAAEMEGTEQLIGLIQTVAEIAAISLVTQGMGTAGAIANAARAGRAMQGALQTAAGARRIGQGAEALAWASKAEYGMKMGMAISATENAVAFGTGEVRQGPETLLAWGKDSLTTGAAMSLFGPLSMGGGSAQVSRNLGKELFHRYAQQGAKGLGHLAKDTAAETGEELFDAQLRQGLDGHHRALGADQIREITLVSGFGGAQMGALNHGFRILQQKADITIANSRKDSAEDPEAAAPQAFSAAGRQLLLAPMWMFLGAGGPGGLPPGRGETALGKAPDTESHAKRLAAVHARLEPVFAKVGEPLTLRDLLLAGQVTAEMSLKNTALSMEESLRIVYADRFANEEMREEVQKIIRKGVEQEESRDEADRIQGEALSSKYLLAQLSSWNPRLTDGSRNEDPIIFHIPGPESLVFAPSTFKAVQGLAAGILTRTPVYLLGETGTGKNAMLRYLACRTGTPLIRINFNRETDASQLFGHLEIERDEQGNRRVVLRDGRMIRAMRHGAWVVWDEANLASEAFLVAQNDLIQQIQTGKVTVRQGGKLVAIDVHPHFRLFATGNPEGYAGRKATERSFGNRWLKIFVQPMSVEEQQAFLATEYKELSPESAEVIPAALHALKLVLGGEKITIRTLKLVAGRIQEMESESLWERGDAAASPQLTPQGMRACLSAIEAEVLDGLNGEDYQKAVQALAQVLPRGTYEIKDYVSQPPSREEFEAKVGEYAGLLDRGGQEKNQGREQKEDREEPEAQEHEARDWGEFVPVPTFLKYAAKALDSLIRGDHLLIEGPPATSKSSFMRLIGRLSGQEVIEATGSADHSSADMIGMPALDEAGLLIFEEGYFLKALKEGAILVINEANLIPAEVLERLNSVFDDDRMIVVSENGHEAPVKAHPNFRLILTQNPAGMNGGRKRHSPALENKFRKIFIRDAISQEELTLLARESFPALAPAAGEMARFHQEAARTFTGAGVQLTLRDLGHWGLIAAALAQSGTLRPHEALLLGAELAYLSRSADPDLREKLQPEMSRLAADLSGKTFPREDVQEEADPVRQTIRRILADPEVENLQAVYMHFAALQGMNFESWLPRVLRELPEREFEEVLTALQPMKPEDELRLLKESKNHAARTRLLKMLEEADRGICVDVARFLIHMFPSDGEVGSALRARMLGYLEEHGYDAGGAEYAVSILGTVGRGDKKIKQILLEMLSDIDCGVPEGWIADALGNLGIADDGVENGLRNIIDRDHGISGFIAVQALVKLGLADEGETRQFLFEFISNEGDYWDFGEARRGAWKLLDDLGIADEEARERLRMVVVNQRVEIVDRFAAVSRLDKLGRDGEFVRDAVLSMANDLLSEMRDADSRVRESAITGCRHTFLVKAVQQGPIAEALQQGLLERLHDEKESIRFEAATSLVALGLGLEAVEAWLADQFSRQKNWTDKLKAAEMLFRLGRGEEIREEVFRNWREYPYYVFRLWSEFGMADERFQSVLIEALKEDETASAAERFLDQVFPGWDREVQQEFRKYNKILAQELSRKQSEVVEGQGVALAEVERGLPKWQAKGREAEGLAAYIPGEAELFIGGSTAQALQGMVGGILARLPVYLMGETGTGKNAMLRYLAHQTGTPLLRINFNRETDASQLYGHFEIERDAQGRRRVVLRDGKMVQAMRHGAWVIWDEANLASESFLVAQNDLIQQIQTGRVTVRQGGKLVTIDVHPHFRLFATGNPEGYAGRKATERSFGNRWLKIFVRPMSVEEQQAFLATEYKDLSPESAESLPALLHTLKIILGGERVTLRTLKRVAVRIAEAEGKGKDLWEGPATLWVSAGEGRHGGLPLQLSASGMEAYVAALEAEVLDGLNGEDYAKAVQALAQALPRGEQAVSDYLNRPARAEEFFAEAERYRGVAGALPEGPLRRDPHWEDLVPVPTTVKYARKVLDSFRRGDHVLIEGPPALSKSAIPKWLGKLLHQPVIEVTGSPDHSASEMIGMPSLDEAGNLIFQEGYFLKALQEGAILILNEANLIPAEVLERLNSVFDDDKMIVVSENGREAPVKAHPKFRLVLTQNPAGMNGGRKRHSPALENKFRKIFIRDAFSQEELILISRKNFPALSTAAEEMARFHQETARTFAGAGIHLTLRDLRHWGLIATAFTQAGTLPPHEALLLGAELAYLSRSPDPDLREKLQPEISRLAADLTGKNFSRKDFQADPSTAPLREKIKKILEDPKRTSVQEVYETFAREKLCGLDVLLAKALPRDEKVITEILSHLSWPHWVKAEWIERFQIKSGFAFLEQLLAGDPYLDPIYQDSARSAAARALGGLGDERAFPLLARTLGDKKDSVKSAAIEALGTLGDVRAFPDLEKILSDLTRYYRPYRVSAAKALGKLRDKRAIPILKRALKDDNLDVRAAAAEALGELGHKRSFLLLERALEDKFAFVIMRRSVVRAFGKLGDTRAIWRLERVLENKKEDAEVRSAAAEALGELGPKHSFSFLHRALRDSNVSVRNSAARALGKSGDIRAVPLLESVLANEEVEEVRISAAMALVELGHRKTFRFWEQVLRSPYSYPSSRHSAVMALAGLGDSRALPLLKEALEDTAPDVRFSAAEALDKLAPGWDQSFPEAFAALQKMLVDELSRRLDDADERQKKRIKSLLRSLPKWEASETEAADPLRQIIRRLLEDPEATDLGKIYAHFAAEEGLPLDLWLSRVLRGLPQEAFQEMLPGMGRPEGAVIELLSRSKNPAAGDLLLEWLQDEDLAQDAVDGLGRLGLASEAVVRALVEKLRSDGNPVIRMCAAEALGRLGSTEEAVLKALRARLNDEDVDVRMAAARALDEMGFADEAVRDVYSAILEDPRQDEWDLDPIPTLQELQLRLDAAEALARWGNPGRAVPFLLERFQDPQEEEGVKIWAAGALLRWRGRDEDLERFLLNRARYGYSFDSVPAAQVLAGYNLYREEVREALLWQWEGHPGEQGEIIAKALARLGQADEAVRETLLKILGHKDEGEAPYSSLEGNWAAAEALDRLFPGWDQEILVKFQKYQKILAEELSQRLSAVEGPQKIKIESLLRALPKWEAVPPPAPDPQRQVLRRLLQDPELHDPVQLQRALAGEHQVALYVWMGYFMKDAPQEELEAFLDKLPSVTDWKPWPEEWIAQFGLRQGLPYLLRSARLQRWDHRERRCAAIQALGQLGVNNPEVEAVLAGGLKITPVQSGAGLMQTSTDIPRLALRSLRRLGLKSPILQAGIQGLFAAPNSALRREAAEAWVELGLPVPLELSQVLLDRVAWSMGRVEERVDAARALGLLRHAPAAEALRAALTDSEYLVGIAAAEALGRMGLSVEEARRHLLQRLENVSPEVRVAAAQSLAALVWGGEDVERSLIARLKARGFEERRAMAVALGAPQPLSLAARAALLKVLDKDRHFKVRLAAARALSRSPERVPEVESFLEDALHKGDPDDRQEAWEILVSLAWDAPKIEGLLLEAGQDMPWDRAAAARGMAERGIRSEAAKKVLLGALRDEWDAVGFPALRALNQLFPEWDRELKAVAHRARTLIPEELARKQSDVVEATAVELAEIERGLPHWRAQGPGAQGLAAYVPGEAGLFLGGSTAQALKGLVGGILARLPVYLMGETGTGKNAMLRYLAHLTGTPLLRLNFNRETDAAQLYGHFEIERDAEGKRRVVLRDGKMIQAMRHGAWVVWDEANLASEAFLVAQNDLIQQIQAGKVTVRQGGKLVAIEVHPHFRLFATGNPEGYAGRKATERSFGNRWLKIFVQPMPVEEQQAFLATEYKELSPRSAESLPAVLHALKIAMGGERVTLRTLKRVARRIVEVEGRGKDFWEGPATPGVSAGEARHGGLPLQLSALGMEAYVAALEAEVLDGLNGEDYAKAVQALAQALPRGEHVVPDYLNRPIGAEEFFAEVEGDRGAVGAVSERSLQSNAHWEDLVPVPTTVKYAQKVLDSFRRGDHVLIEGPPALSKSAIPKWLGKLLNQPVIEVTGSPDHSASEMIGMPSLDEAGNLIFQEGYFLKALQEGAILILNEANLIPAEVLERLNSVFDDDRMIVVSENGREAPVKAHPKFRLVLTQNPAGMNGGRKRHSLALENKFRKIFIRDAFSQEELEAIVGAALAPGRAPTPPRTQGGGGSSGGPEGPRSPRHRPSPAAHPLPARVSPAMGTARWFAAVALPGVALDSVFERKGKARSSEAPRLPATEQKRLEEKAAAATEEVQARIDAFMSEHGRTLENLGSLAAMKRIRVLVDLTGEVDLAALNLDTGEMWVNPLAAGELSPGQIAAIALHEGGHGAVSRVGDGFFFEKRSRHLLANCLEDPRVNEYALARLPGARGDFASLYEKFFPPTKADPAAKPSPLPPLGELPHEQFALGFLELWANGRVTGRIDLPEVREALESLEPVARRIWGTHPHFYHPQEKEVLAKQNEVYALVREKILPSYERFYQVSLGVLEERLREGHVGEGRPVPGIDAEDLSAEARELLERRAGRLAERLEPREAAGRRREQVERARRRGEGAGLGAGASPYRESDFKPYGEKTVADLLQERGIRKANREAFYDNNPWRRYFDPVSGVAAQLAELLRQVLRLDADFDYRGHYVSGPRLDVRKAVETLVKNEAGIFSEGDLKLFLRKKFPTRRSHKFVLLLDESGSMKGDSQAPALQAVALFLHVLEGLRVDHVVAGFSDTPNLHKDFQDLERSEAAKNALMAELESAGGGGTNDLAGLKLAAELLAGQEAEEKTVIVVTDGMGVDTTAAYVKDLEAAGVKVVGVGVGAGTESVTRVYGDHYQSADFRDLPKTLLRILARRMLGA
ncbi:VWA domain-containing protein [Deltaproteobacteria bacterium PRO3]|nr:VWA domain-containing protein [Deltaproteobacteria bacterium PRO3]